MDYTNYILSGLLAIGWIIYYVEYSKRLAKETRYLRFLNLLENAVLLDFALFILLNYFLFLLIGSYGILISFGIFFIGYVLAKSSNKK